MVIFEPWQSTTWEDTQSLVISGPQLKTKICSQVLHIIMLYLFMCQILLAKIYFQLQIQFKHKAVQGADSDTSPPDTRYVACTVSLRGQEKVWPTAQANYLPIFLSRLVRISHFLTSTASIWRKPILVNYSKCLLHFLQIKLNLVVIMTATKLLPHQSTQGHIWSPCLIFMISRKIHIILNAWTVYH